MQYQVYESGRLLAKVPDASSAVFVAMRYPDTVIKFAGRVMWNKKKEVQGQPLIDHELEVVSRVADYWDKRCKGEL